MFDNTTSGKSVICVTVVKLCLWRLLLRVATNEAIGRQAADKERRDERDISGNKAEPAHPPFARSVLHVESNGGVRTGDPQQSSPARHTIRL